MAESCQAYKCTYGSRLEYLCSFIIIFFFTSTRYLRFWLLDPRGVIPEKNYIFDGN